MKEDACRGSHPSETGDLAEGLGYSAGDSCALTLRRDKSGPAIG